MVIPIRSSYKIPTSFVRFSILEYDIPFILATKAIYVLHHINVIFYDVNLGKHALQIYNNIISSLRFKL
jgi:hypothetical protein